MTFLPAKAWKDGVVGRRLRELGQHLAKISRRVAEAVTEAIRETAAKLACDALGRILPRRLSAPAVPKWRDDPEEEYDPWTDEEEPGPWRAHDEIQSAEVAPEPSAPAAVMPVARSALALALAVSAWWLRRQGSLWGAFGIGLIAATAAAVVRSLTGEGQSLVQAAHELLTYHHAVSGLGAP
jgi:hypothetical protein